MTETPFPSAPAEFSIGRHGTRHVTREQFRTAARTLGSDPDTIEAAWSNVANGDARLLVMTGKLASGKDTVGAEVMRRLVDDRVRHLYFALPLKSDVDMFISAISTAHSPQDAAGYLADVHEMALQHAEHLVSLLWEPTRPADHGLDARTRTDEMRLVLQYYGTEVRRSQDPDHWVKRALAPAVQTLAEGTSVYLSDARFPNECDTAALLGGTVVRLLVTPQVQAARLLARDGTKPDPAALSHPSETQLDDYAGFDLRVDADGPLESVVREVVAFLPERRPATALAS